METRQVRRKRIEDEHKLLAKTLLDDMTEAQHTDSINIREGINAMAKTRLCQQIEEQLRIKSVQQYFLDMDGCTLLADWLSIGADRLTYPPLHIVRTILSVLEKLPIETRHLEENHLAKVVERYSEDLTDTPEVVQQSMRILHRWQAIVHEVNYSYDADYKMQAKNLREKLRFLEDDDKETQEDLIRKTNTGRDMLQQSNFDFIDHPTIKIP